MRKTITTACLMMTTVLGGCAAGVPGLRPLSYQEPAETRVFASHADCPNESQAGNQIAPIVAAALLGAASKLLDGFGNALTKGSEGGALPSSIAMTNIELGGNEMPKCLIIIRGRFANGGVATAGIPNTGAVQGDDGIYTSGPIFLKAAGGGQGIYEPLPEVAELFHYVELQLRSSSDSSALTFAPVYTWIPRSMDGSVKGTRELSVAVKFERPGKPATGSAVLLGRRVIGEKQKYEFSSGRYPYESPWFAGLSAASSGASPPVGQQQGEGTIVTEGATGTPPPPPTPGAKPRSQPFPVTLTTTVVETRPTKQFIAFVASVFTAARPAIDAALKSEIDPVTGEAETKTSYDAQATYATAEAKAHSDRLAYCAMKDETTASARFTASALARSSQILANKAALTADLTEPFPTGKLVAVSGGAVMAANLAACS